MDTPAAKHTDRAPWAVVVVASMTGLTMLAFAANSLLTRLALQTTTIDPASFATTRLATGALMLTLIVAVRRERVRTLAAGWLSATLLFIYAAAFSFAYRSMGVGTGALVLFASAQLLMITYGYARGEKTSLFGLALALAGLVVFLAPSSAAPPLSSTVLMVTAGLAWGAYSLLGRAGDSPTVGTARSFIWAVPLSLVLLLVERAQIHVDVRGLVYASISGAVTSALGYVLWYWVRVRMTAISAGTVQLSVPVLSALLGVLLLGEHVSLRAAVSAVAVLAGVALTTVFAKARSS
ncbi:MAG: EamA family transporter [Rhodocyclaceae bacterium]